MEIEIVFILFMISMIALCIYGIYGLILFIRCALVKVVKKEYKYVDVTIVKGSRGNVTFGEQSMGQYVSYSEEENRITVIYEDKEYTIRGDSSYEKYLDKKGKQVTGILETKYYSDDSISYDIVALAKKIR